MNSSVCIRRFERYQPYSHKHLYMTIKVKVHQGTLQHAQSNLCNQLSVLTTTLQICLEIIVSSHHIIINTRRNGLDVLKTSSSHRICVWKTVPLEFKQLQISNQSVKKLHNAHLIFCQSDNDGAVYI